MLSNIGANVFIGLLLLVVSILFIILFVLRSVIDDISLVNKEEHHKIGELKQINQALNFQLEDYMRHNSNQRSLIADQEELISDLVEQLKKYEPDEKQSDQQSPSQLTIDKHRSDTGLNVSE